MSGKKTFKQDDVIETENNWAGSTNSHPYHSHALHLRLYRKWPHVYTLHTSSFYSAIPSHHPHHHMSYRQLYTWLLPYHVVSRPVYIQIFYSFTSTFSPSQLPYFTTHDKLLQMDRPTHNSPQPHFSFTNMPQDSTGTPHHSTLVSVDCTFCLHKVHTHLIPTKTHTADLAFCFRRECIWSCTALSSQVQTNTATCRGCTHVNNVLSQTCELTYVIGHVNACLHLWKLATWSFVYRGLTVLVQCPEHNKLVMMVIFNGH